MSAARPADAVVNDAGGPCERPVPLQLEELRLSHSLLFSLFGQVGYVLTQMAVLATLAQLRGSEAVGEFGLALAITTPAFIFVNMGGKSSQSSDVTQKYSFAAYGGLVLVAAALATLVSVLAGAIFARNFNTLLIVAIVAATKFVESFSSLSYGAFQQAGRADKITWSLLLRGGLTVPIFALVLWLGVPTGVAFLAQLTVWSCTAFLRDYPLASRIAAGRLVRPSLQPARIMALLRETAPLGGGYFINSLLTSLPRLFVERSLGLSAVGILTVVTYIQQAGTIVVAAMSQALVNRFARLKHAGETGTLRKTIIGILLLVVACSVAGLLLVDVAGTWILGTVFGPEFRNAGDLLMLIALALCARLFSVVPQSLLHAERRFGTFLLRELATAIPMIALLWVLVPRYGLIGAGYAIVGASVSRLAIMTVAVTAGRERRPLDNSRTPRVEVAAP
jgi:O-antigen/teichoic acid export membrane protein